MHPVVARLLSQATKVGPVGWLIECAMCRMWVSLRGCICGSMEQPVAMAKIKVHAWSGDFRRWQKVRAKTTQPEVEGTTPESRRGDRTRSGGLSWASLRLVTLLHHVGRALGEVVGVGVGVGVAMGSHASDACPLCNAHGRPRHAGEG